MLLSVVYDVFSPLLVGKLVDAGTHAQLLERCHDYRKMVELQNLEEEGGVSNA